MKDKKRFTNSRVRFLDNSTSLDIQQVENDSEIFQCSVASEIPVLVGEYYEILDIASMDISRLLDGGCVLFDHDPANYIGVVTECWKEGTKLYAKFKFASHPFAQQVKQDVIGGILNKISIGYSVTSFSYEKEMDGLDVMRCGSVATEFSIVTVPADMTVGIGRSLTKRDLQEQINELNKDGENMDEVIQLINDLKAEMEALKLSIEEIKTNTAKVEPTEAELEAERKRSEEDNKTKEEEETRKRALEEENGDVVSESDVDQAAIDKAVEELANQITDATDADVNVDDVIADIEKEINDVVDDTVEDLDEEVDEEEVV